MGKMIIGSALWSRYVEGDMQAQEIIYKSFFRSLYQYGMKIHPDHHMVKDCIQETMIAFFEKKRYPSTYNQAKLLQNRKIFLKYKYQNGAGNWCYATDTLTFRNRIRDGVNEWQDENPENYK